MLSHFLSLSINTVYFIYTVPSSFVLLLKDAALSHQSPHLSCSQKLNFPARCQVRMHLHVPALWLEEKEEQDSPLLAAFCLTDSPSSFSRASRGRVSLGKSYLYRMPADSNSVSSERSLKSQGKKILPIDWSVNSFLCSHDLLCISRLPRACEYIPP